MSSIFYWELELESRRPWPDGTLPGTIRPEAWAQAAGGMALAGLRLVSESWPAGPGPLVRSRRPHHHWWQGSESDGWQSDSDHWHAARLCSLTQLTWLCYYYYDLKAVEACQWVRARILRPRRQDHQCRRTSAAAAAAAARPPRPGGHGPPWSPPGQQQGHGSGSTVTVTFDGLGTGTGPGRRRRDTAGQLSKYSGTTAWLSLAVTVRLRDSAGSRWRRARAS